MHKHESNVYSSFLHFENSWRQFFFCLVYLRILLLCSMQDWAWLFETQIHLLRPETCSPRSKHIISFLPQEERQSQHIIFWLYNSGHLLLKVYLKPDAAKNVVRACFHCMFLSCWVPSSGNNVMLVIFKVMTGLCGVYLLKSLIKKPQNGNLSFRMLVWDSVISTNIGRKMM